MFKVGESVFIRTVTYHHVGKVKKKSGDFLHLTNASWVADSGRFGRAIAEGTLEEVEYVGEVAVNIATIVDVLPWAHDLPVSSK